MSELERCRCSNANGPNGEVVCDVWVIEASGLQSELCLRCESFLPVVRNATLRFSDVRLFRKGPRTQTNDAKWDALKAIACHPCRSKMLELEEEPLT